MNSDIEQFQIEERVLIAIVAQRKILDFYVDLEHLVGRLENASLQAGKIGSYPDRSITVVHFFGMSVEDIKI